MARTTKTEVREWIRQHKDELATLNALLSTDNARALGAKVDELAESLDEIRDLLSERYAEDFDEHCATLELEDLEEEEETVVAGAS